MPFESEVTKGWLRCEKDGCGLPLNPDPRVAAWAPHQCRNPKVPQPGPRDVELRYRGYTIQRLAKEWGGSNQVWRIYNGRGKLINADYSDGNKVDAWIDRRLQEYRSRKELKVAREGNAGASGAEAQVRGEEAPREDVPEGAHHKG